MTQNNNLNLNFCERLEIPNFSDLSFSDQLYQISLARAERETYRFSEKKVKPKKSSKKSISGKKKDSLTKVLSSLSPEQIEDLKRKLS